MFSLSQINIHSFPMKSNELEHFPSFYDINICVQICSHCFDNPQVFIFLYFFELKIHKLIINFIGIKSYELYEQLQ